MGEWVTQREAAALLGVHKSAVPKMIARGVLHPRTGARPTLSRAEVIELAASRDAEAQARVAAQDRPRGPQPPDGEHDWLPARAAAAVLGIKHSALSMRVSRGRVPSVKHDGVRWYRLDHLELLLRAQAARSTMQR
jgi:excisionase family DNA binding protein